MVLKHINGQIPSAADIAEETKVSFVINDSLHETAVEPQLLLIDFLRDTLGLTGAKFGCETGQCGACTILVDGVSVKSCAMLTAQADGCHITTIEGVSKGGSLTPLQTSLWQNHAVQCGYCTPGMILSLTDLLNHNPHPSEAEVRQWIDGNMCRCGVYQNVVRAVQSLSAQAQ
jgi:aerobic carbon-monoxide dehydrogenase small subunit